MKLIRKNIIIILVIILGMIAVSGISAYGTYMYFAKDVMYTKEGTEARNVEQALNELYNNKKETSDVEQEITTNGKQALDKYYKNINVNVPNTGEGISWKKGTATMENGACTIDIGFNPSKTFIYYSTDNDWYGTFMLFGTTGDGYYAWHNGSYDDSRLDKVTVSTRWNFNDGKFTISNWGGVNANLEWYAFK